MNNQDEMESNSNELPNVNEEKYKKMTEALLSNDSEIQNLSYSNLVHLADYLKEYQSALVKQNQFQKAKKIGDIKDKILIEIKSQTNQLNQYNKKGKYTEYAKNYYRSYY